MMDTVLSFFRALRQTEDKYMLFLLPLITLSLFAVGAVIMWVFQTLLR